MFDQDEFDEFILDIENSAGFFDPPIRLKSGRTGHYYFDLRNALNSRETKHRLAKYVYDFAVQNGLKPETFLGVPEGATPVASAATDLIDYLPDVPVPVLRTAPKGHGDPRDRSSIGHLNRGSKVVILEDVTTTGGSSTRYVLQAQNAGVDILGFVAIVNRMEIRDGGLTVPEFFDRVLHVKYYSMTDAGRLLPKMYSRLNPPEHVARNTENYFRQYCGRELQLRF